MSIEVYANGMSIACKAASGKTVAAMPDVCLSPPSPPAGPVPIPYPNTAMASDTTDGSKTVQIGGDEVMLKNKSSFKQSNGDEAATKSFGMGVVTHQIQGKVNFCAWSMDVKFEGENVPRNLDLTGHNESSDPPNTPPWPYVDGAAIAPDDPCKKEKKKVQKKCSPEKDWQKNCPPAPTAPNTLFPNLRAPSPSSPDYAPYMQLCNQFEQDMNSFRTKVNENPCLRARRCMLVPKEQKKKDPKSPKGECCPGQTPHHIIDGASFTGMPGWGNYNYNAAACVCCEGFNQTAASHGEIHLRTGVQCQEALKPGGSGWSRSTAKTAGVKSVRKTFPGSGCSQKCLEAQVDKSHDDAKSDPAKPDSPIQPVAQKNMEKDQVWRNFARADMQ